MTTVIRTPAMPWRRLAIASLALATMMAFGVPNAYATSGTILIGTPSSTSTTEAGGTVTFDVTLPDSPATGETVTVTATSSNTDEATVSTPSSLTFTPSDWNVAKTITVKGVDDTIVDGDAPFTITLTASTAGASTYTSATLELTNIDNDTPSITVGPISGMTGEDGTAASFTVVLDVEPSGTVTIPVSSLDTSEGTVSTSPLSFTTTDWSTAKTVTVNGVDDEIVDGDVPFTVVLGVASGGGYDGLGPNNVSVTNTDNDTAGFAITETDGSTATHESGTTDTFDVVLTKGPVNDVVLTVTSSDTGEGVVDKSTLTFTNVNWSTAQTVTVTGIDDISDDGGQSYTITVAVAAASSDDAFDALVAQTITAFNGDNDVTPVEPSFGDLDGLSAEAVAAIETLVDLGITTGTDDTSFSPAMITERWQMALFLTRVLDATGTTLPTAGSGFSDLTGYSAEAQVAMNQLAILEISTGTSPDEFSPSGAVTRWQMALFLVRTLEAGGVTLPSAGDSTFTDLGQYPVEVQAAVDVLVTLGITTGTTETMFSPDTELPRWQMALFLSRVIDVIQG